MVRPCNIKKRADLLKEYKADKKSDIASPDLFYYKAPLICPKNWSEMGMSHRMSELRT